MKTFLVFLTLFVPFVTCQLSQLLLETIKQNPAILSSLQNNPDLLRNILLNQQRNKPQEADQQCAALRKQNKLLKQMIFSVTGNEAILPRQERILDPAQVLLQQVEEEKPIIVEPQISLKSVLITPSATWTTSMTTTSYVTTVTHTETSEVPIILRGSRVITTILQSDTQVVTATEIKTSSILVTPEPTWSIQSVTITPSQVLNPQPLISSLPKFSQPLDLNLPTLLDGIPKKRKVRPNQAQVVEINKNPRNDFKSAYGAFFASSAQRSAERFGDILRPARNSNPLFSSQDEDDYDYSDFDQQWLAAQNRPVFLSPPKKSKVFTLYFSGTKPGQFTTKLTQLPVDSNGQPILARNKRHINPSKVEPIENTLPPFFQDLDSGSFTEEFLESSFKEVETSTVTVTKTERITVTV